jgi:hypothetical protein
MFIVTNVAAIESIITAKAPRPWREVVLEIYPGATEDRNGRFHSPYDGYECSITGRCFRAGEYLPMSEPDDTYIGIGGYITHPTAIDANGIVHTWENLGKAQRNAVFAELLAQSKANDAAKSDFVGKIGEKTTIEAVLNVVKCYSGGFGPIFFHVMKDTSGSVIFYKGSKRLGFKGDNIKLTAKVKLHDIREGVKQTVIERPKLV